MPHSRLFSSFFLIGRSHEVIREIFYQPIFILFSFAPWTNKVLLTKANVFNEKCIEAIILMLDDSPGFCMANTSDECLFFSPSFV
jgi:hypothetical protein